MESEPSDDLNLDNEKNLRHISYLITEMRDTEVTYIDALTDVTKVFVTMPRFKNNPRNGLYTLSSKDSMFRATFRRSDLVKTLDSPKRLLKMFLLILKIFASFICM